MKTRSFAKALAGVLACGCLALPALAGPPVADMNFMKNAAYDGNFEVTLGKIAQMNGGSKGVRQFGMMMVRDHTTVNTKLMGIGMKEGVTLPTGVGPVNRPVVARLSSLHGPAFDRAYVKVAIAGHEKDLTAFRKEASTGKNPPVRALAGKYAPVVQAHLMMAQQLPTKAGRMGT